MIVAEADLRGKDDARPEIVRAGGDSLCCRRRLTRARKPSVSGRCRPSEWLLLLGHEKEVVKYDSHFAPGCGSQEVVGGVYGL
jgi:hypothetical protein